MITYIIKSQGYYKIGKTKDIATRLKVFNTHCFEFKLIKLIYADIETLLHTKFESKRVKLEWFKLSKSDFKKVDKLLLQLSDVSCDDNDEKWDSFYRDIGYRKRFSIESRAKMAKSKHKRIASINNDGDIIRIFDSIKEASQELAIPETTLRSRCKNKSGFTYL